MIPQASIFVTGAGGFIGRHVVPALLAKHFKLVCLAKFPEERWLEHPDVTWLVADILDPDSYSTQLLACDYLLHMASEIRNPNIIRQININGWKSLLDVVSTKPTIRILLLGSAGIYGIYKHPEQCISENAKQFPNTPYEITKAKQETILYDYARTYSLKYIILRPSNVFGEFDRQNKLLNLFSAVLNGRLVLIGKRTQVNYIYAGHLAEIIAQVFEKNIFRNDALNMNVTIPLHVFISKIHALTKSTKDVPILPGLFKPILWIFALVFHSLPKFSHVFNLNKYTELTNSKTYDTTLLRQLFPDTDHQAETLDKGLENLYTYFVTNKQL